MDNRDTPNKCIKCGILTNDLHNGALVYRAYAYMYTLIGGLYPDFAYNDRFWVVLVPSPPSTITNCWDILNGVPPGYPLNNDQPGDQPLPIYDFYDYDLLSHGLNYVEFMNSWQDGMIIYEVYRPGTAMYKWAWGQWLKYRNSTIYRKFLDWVVNLAVQGSNALHLYYPSIVGVNMTNYTIQVMSKINDLIYPSQASTPDRHHQCLGN